MLCPSLKAALIPIGIRIAVWLEKKPLPLPSWEGVGGRGRSKVACGVGASPGGYPSPCHPPTRGGGKILLWPHPILMRMGLVPALACWLLAGCGGHQSDSQQPSMNAESRLHVAAAAEESGDRDLAISMYTAAASEAPADTPTQLRCAEGLARSGKLEDAAGLLARRLKTAPHDPEVLRTMGAIQVMAGQPVQAIQTLSLVLAAKPDDPTALANKAVALDILHRHDEAQGLYRQALSALPNDPTISNDLALSLMLSGRTEEARQTLSPFRDVAGLPERMTINLGIMEAASGHAQEAEQLLGSRIAATDLASLTRAIGKFTPAATGQR